jgi:hypothetical protein
MACATVYQLELKEAVYDKESSHNVCLASITQGCNSRAVTSGFGVVGFTASTLPFDGSA